MTLSEPSSGSPELRPELRDEIRHTLAARRELGLDLDDALVDAFAQRIQGIISAEVARQVGSRSQETKQLLDWRKEMYAITLGIGVPLLAIGAFTAQLLGVLVVCVMLALISLAWTGRTC